MTSDLEEVQRLADRADELLDEGEYEAVLDLVEELPSSEGGWGTLLAVVDEEEDDPLERFLWTAHEAATALAESGS